MIGTIATVIYAMGGIWGFRHTLRGFVAYNEREYPRLGFDTTDLIFGVFFALIGGAVWPLVAVRAGLLRTMPGHDPKAVARALAGEGREAKRARREKELAEREEHVARLEKDLGIGQDADVVPLRREQQ